MLTSGHQPNEKATTAHNVHLPSVSFLKRLKFGKTTSLVHDSMTAVHSPCIMLTSALQSKQTDHEFSDGCSLPLLNMAL